MQTGKAQVVVDLTGDVPVSVSVQPPPPPPRGKKRRKAEKVITGSMRLAYWMSGQVPAGVENHHEWNVDSLWRGKPKVSLCPGMVIAVVRTGVPFYMDPCTCSWKLKHFELPVEGWIRFFQAREYCEHTDTLLWNFVNVVETFDNFDFNSVSLPPFTTFEKDADYAYWVGASSAYFYILLPDASKPVHDWIPDPCYHSGGGYTRFYYHVSCIQTCNKPAPKDTVWLDTATPKCLEYEEAQETNAMMKEQLDYANAVMKNTE